MTTKIFVLATILFVVLPGFVEGDVIIPGVTKPRVIVVGASEPEREKTRPVVPAEVPEAIPTPTPTKPPAKPKATPQPVAYYPVHAVRWNVNGYWNYSREYILEHLLEGQHRGKFDRSWLESLGMNELQSLHDDDHDGRVKWEFVGRPGTVPAQPQRVQPISTPVIRYQYSNQSCPNGNCPDQRFQQPQRRGGLFRIFRR